MIINYNGKKVHEVVTNHSMSIEDAIALFVDVNNQNELENRKDDLPYIYWSDNNEYDIDWDGFEMKW